MSGPPPARGSRARAERLGGSVPTKAAKPAAPAKAGKAAGAGAVGGRSARTAAASASATATVVERELTPDELAALEEQRAFLLTSLRDLEAEHDVGDVDENDYEQLKDDYTARAAAVIRSIDSHHQLVAARAPRTSWSRRILVLAAVAAVALLYIAPISSVVPIVGVFKLMFSGSIVSFVIALLIVVPLVFAGLSFLGAMGRDLADMEVLLSVLILFWGPVMVALRGLTMEDGTQVYVAICLLWASATAAVSLAQLLSMTTRQHA